MRHPSVRKRDSLPLYFNDLGFKHGAEIGTRDGNYSLYLCKTIPELKLYCIDLWDVYPGYQIGESTEKHLDAFNTAKKRLEGYNVRFIQKYSMDAVKSFENESLDFVYIDANHQFDYVMEDIIEWAKKVRVGGIVSGHDYFHFPAGDGGVVQAVDVYASVHKVEQVYLTDDREHSWFFFKGNK